MPGPAPYEEFYGPVGAQKWKDKTLGSAWHAHDQPLGELGSIGFVAFQKGGSEGGKKAEKGGNK